ncbi:hypothetical protein DAI22_10g100300 [Oryza sativa Japonica Group]|nr:hypothetical protein DAI22_10g100300 [Oryza sativa Japonica Group]
MARRAKLTINLKLRKSTINVEQLIHVRLRQILNFMGGKTAYIKKFDGTVGVPILRSKRVPPSEVCFDY